MDVLGFSNPLQLELNTWCNMQQTGTEIGAVKQQP
jgi:hypothetical protein